MEGSKACTKCGVVKLFSEFYKKPDRPSLRSACKACLYAIEKARRHENPEKYKAEQRAYYSANPEKYKAKRKSDYSANPEKYKARTNKWKAENIEKVSFAYVAICLQMPISELTEDIYLLKREQIFLSRDLRELTKATKGLNHEDRN